MKLPVCVGYTAEFRYSERCPRTVVADVDQCSTKHLTYRHVLRFHDDNQLVAIGNEQSVDAACRSATSATLCILSCGYSEKSEEGELYMFKFGPHPCLFAPSIVNLSAFFGPQKSAHRLSISFLQSRLRL